MVQWVRKHWYMDFSQRFTDVAIVMAKRVYNDITLAINSEGVFALMETRTAKGVTVKPLIEMKYVWRVTC